MKQENKQKQTNKLVHQIGIGVNNLRRILHVTRQGNLSNLQEYVLMDVLKNLEVLASDMPKVIDTKAEVQTTSSDGPEAKAPVAPVEVPPIDQAKEQ
jgi:hypothetical protein